MQNFMKNGNATSARRTPERKLDPSVGDEVNGDQVAEPMANLGANSVINALNTLCAGWTEARPGGLLCNPNAGGGIIDSEIMSGEWFVIFNDARETLSGYDSRDDAIEAFAIASR